MKQFKQVIALAAKLHKESWDMHNDEYTKNIQESANEAVEQLGYYDLAAQPVYLLLTNSWNEALDWVKSTELAPVNNGIPVLDTLCTKYNNEELTLHQLVRSIWNESVKD